MKKNLTVLGEFLGHLAVGATMFVALLLFGAGLNLLVQWIAPIVGDDSFSELMKLVEKIILYGDVVFIVWWVSISIYGAIKEISHE